MRSQSANLTLMSLIYRFTTLDDAYSLLLEAKGLPKIAGTSSRAQRSVRASILLSWIAVEEGLDHAIALWKKEGKLSGPLPKALKPRLSTVLAELSRPPIDEVHFTKLRKIRNGLTHPRAMVDEPELAVELAEITFEFCAASVRSLFPYRVEWHFDGPPSHWDISARHACCWARNNYARR
jgi:hypothetical protein